MNLKQILSENRRDQFTTYFIRQSINLILKPEKVIIKKKQRDSIPHEYRHKTLTHFEQIKFRNRKI